MTSTSGGSQRPRPEVPWTGSRLESQRGRTYVVTGANSGLGLAVASQLGAAGARVVMAVRDLDKGKAAQELVPGQSEVRRLDLADLSSVRGFVAELAGPVDVLVNNAGIMGVPFRRTPDGFESQLGTNHLGPFALTNLLLPRLTDRVVTVSSGMHWIGGLRLADLNWERRRYRPWRAYSQSKLANLLFTSELQRRLDAVGSSLRATAAHPGYAATGLQGHTGNPVSTLALAAANRIVAQSSSQGAWPILFAATQDIPGDTFVGPSGLGGRGSPALSRRSGAAQDRGLAQALWRLSEDLTQTHFPLE